MVAMTAWTRRDLGHFARLRALWVAVNQKTPGGRRMFKLPLVAGWGTTKGTGGSSNPARGVVLGALARQTN